VAWWGKNAMALAPRAGPWLLLGSVATNAPLPISAPMTRDCGTCSSCLPACPTGALVAPGVLDARLCLAHWAQAPGSIPRELRVPMGDRLYGCDDCLDACPPGGRLLAASGSPRGRVDLVELLGRDDRTLLERYSHFYIPRRQVRHLRRNALVALGNTGGPEAIAVCAGYAAHPDAMLRAHAVWALGQLGGRRGSAVLEAVAKREQDPGVLAEVEHALSAVAG
jgi:epoxyqueuosine reductase